MAPAFRTWRSPSRRGTRPGPAWASGSAHNGIAGHEARRIHEFSYPFPDDGLLVLHSDGLKSQWSLDGYPGLAERDPALIAGILFRDFNRGRDDVTVVVARVSRGEHAARYPAIEPDGSGPRVTP
jgi:hypothetical protein